MAKGKAVLDIPCEFGGVSIGDATARLGVRIDRKVCRLELADDVFSGHRLSGRVILGGSQDSQGQTKMVESDEVMEAVFDVKHFGVNASQFTTGLTFSKADVDIKLLAGFSNGSGRLVINDVSELPEEPPADSAKKGKEQLPGMLKAEGPWAEVSLADLFHGGLLKSLNESGLKTVGDLATFSAGDKRLTDINGIGPGKAANIEDRMLQFWSDNPDADKPVAETKAPAASNGSADWRKEPFSSLGLLPPVNEAFEEMKVTTIGGLFELRAAINDSKAVWPKGIGPAKQADVCKRLESFIEEHPEPAAT